MFRITFFHHLQNRLDVQLEEHRRRVAMDWHPFGDCLAPSGGVPEGRDVVDRRPSRAVAAEDRQHVRRRNAWADRLGVVVAVPYSAMVVVVRTAGGRDTASTGGTVAATDAQRIGVHSRANEADF